jgi:hypothetical protein
MNLPTTLPDALALLGQLVHDPNLLLGLATVAVVLIGSGAITAVLLSMWVRR